jgi:signal transduction histidine kinase
MRLRVAISLAALALLVLLAQSVVLVFLLDEKEEEFIERQLDDQLEHSMALWRQSPAAAFPNTPAMSLYRIGNGEAAAQVPSWLAGLQVGNHELYRDDREYHVAVREEEGARYILAYDVEDHELRLRGLMLVTLLASVLLGVLTLLAGYLLSGRLTRRLERLARRVGQEAPGALVEPGMERELQALAVAVEHYRERQGAMLERERAFAANLSHELRTALTGIRTDAELLAASGSGEAVTRRGNRIVGSVDRISDLTTSLLFLAREARPAAVEPILLQPAIEAVWDALMLAAPKPLGLRLDIQENALLRTDPSLLDLVLRNLLDNALRYSESGEIVCRLQGSRLAVIDTGPGFAEGELARVFDRFFIGARGANGLGLALVRHVCLASGWTVTACNAPAGGGEVVVDFGSSLPGD